MEDSSLSEILHKSSILTGATRSGTDAVKLGDVLQSRLAQFRSASGQAHASDANLSLEETQLETALAALQCVELIQHKIAPPAASSSEHNQANITTAGEESTATGSNLEEITIGSKDLAQIRTLLSLVFKWGIGHLLPRVIAALPTKPAPKSHQSASIIDLTYVPNDYKNLNSTLERILRILLPPGLKSSLAHTIVTSNIVSLHFADVLKACAVLGWLPRPLASQSIPVQDSLRTITPHILDAIAIPEAISSLGRALQEEKLPAYAKRALGFLLSRELLKEEGVHGLYSVVFGDEEVSGDEAPLDKLDRVAYLLAVPPAGMNIKGYYAVIVPQLFSIISSQESGTPNIHRRASGFALSRMLTGNENPSLDLSADVRSVIHRPLLRDPTDFIAEKPTIEYNMTASVALSTLQALLLNTDPSPTIISSLLTPIIPSLYALSFHLDSVKTSSPTLKENVKGFLTTWGRVVSQPEGVETLWQIIGGDGGEWRSTVDGEVERASSVEELPSLAMFTPENLRRAEESGELDIDSNILNLRPDPVHFVRYLKSMERVDISSELFVKALEAYRQLKADADADPLRTLLFLQLIMQMQNDLSGNNSASNILNQPHHILSFIKHALDSDNQPPPSEKQPSTTFGLDSLRIVPEANDPDEDSDDESPADDEANPTWRRDEEMTSTAINLLLSLLESHPDLSARTTPILNDIFSLLEPVSKESTEEIRALAREARMVMTARLASTSTPASTKSRQKADEESPQEIYQKALKLLQDPLLPVRAHGLLLLRQLVSARKSTPGSGTLKEPPIDRALVPAVLSIFLQSIQDDDSYIYLNGVQGLAAMVDGFGKEMLKGLMNVYSEGMGSGLAEMTRQEVDVKVRIGEAVEQIVKRCGEALPAYVDIIIPPLAKTLRSSHLPTTLRTSAIALLSQCANTSPLAVIPYGEDLSSAMLDILQLETVAVMSKKTSAQEPAVGEDKSEPEAEEKPKPPDTMDAQPTSKNTKFPPLRRAALHFLSLLVLANTLRIYTLGDRKQNVLPIDISRRMKATVEYLATTDEDTVVRVMAREALDALDQMTRAVLGI